MSAGQGLMRRRQDWQTPPWLFDLLHDEFRFDTDAAASEVNALLPQYWTVQADALRQSWTGRRVFCNPPYGGGLGLWAKKAATETRRMNCPLAVLLIPARTESF